MSSRIDVKLPYKKGGSYYLVNLEDFPYKEDKLIGEKDHIEFYEAEDHIEVLAYDEEKKEIVLTEAKGWSFHKDQEVWTIDLSDKSQIISDDDPRAVYGIDPETLQMGRWRPEESIGKLVPKSDYLTKFSNKPSKLYCTGSGRLKSKIELKEETGSLVGDGWVDVVKNTPKAVNLAGIEKSCFKAYKKALLAIFKKAPHIGHSISTGSWGDSEKRILSSTDFATWVLPLIGKGAENKHLPPFWFSAPEKFKWGLLSGLLDTDGSISANKSKKKDQLQANISSTSLRLVQETQHLLRTLGIRSRISFSKKTDSGKDFWILSISAPDLKKHKDNLCIAHKANRKCLDEVEVEQNSKSAMRNDYVPFNRDIFDYVKSTEKSFHSKHRSLYVTMSRDCKKGRITRYSAQKILDLPNVEEDKFPGNWVNIVRNTDVTWVQVDSVENTGKKEDGYDLTVPGYETFMSVDGIILSNTMSIQVPVTKDGEEEAKAIKPSNILFKHGDGMLVPAITHEYAYGLAKLSEKGKRAGKSFSSIKEARDAGLGLTDVFDLNGKEMTIGQHMINKEIPKKLRDYDKVYNKKEVEKLLTKIGNDYPQYFADVINNFKDLGAMYSYKRGMTMSITDLNIDRSFRDKMVKDRLPKINKIQDKSKRIEEYNKLVQDLEQEQNKQIKGKNNI